MSLENIRQVYEVIQYCFPEYPITLALKMAVILETVQSLNKFY